MSEPTPRGPSTKTTDAYESAAKHPLVSEILAALHEQDAMSYHGEGSVRIGERAWHVLHEIEKAGFTILRTKSYKAAQERQRIAEVMRESAERDKREQREWMERDVFPWQRHLLVRVQHLGLLAQRLGAAPEDMASQWCDCGQSSCPTTEKGTDGLSVDSKHTPNPTTDRAR